MSRDPKLVSESSTFWANNGDDCGIDCVLVVNYCGNLWLPGASVAKPAASADGPNCLYKLTVGHAVYQVRVVSFAAGGGGVALNRRRRLRTLASEWIN